MKKVLLTLMSGSLLLVGCGNDTEGLSEETSRQPKGNPNAAVVVEEFADLQCPACRAAHTEIVAPLIEQYGAQIRYDHKHFPIRSIHRYALEASLAAECAADQGKFWEYVDQSFENQDTMTIDNLLAWGEAAGVSDYALFERCFKTQVKKETILADYNEGRDRGVTGTPTFFVNGERVETDLAKLGEAIQAGLEASSQRL